MSVTKIVTKILIVYLKNNSENTAYFCLTFWNILLKAVTFWNIFLKVVTCKVILGHFLNQL